MSDETHNELVYPVYRKNVDGKERINKAPGKEGSDKGVDRHKPHHIDSRVSSGHDMKWNAII